MAELTSREVTQLSEKELIKELVYNQKLEKHYYARVKEIQAEMERRADGE